MVEEFEEGFFVLLGMAEGVLDGKADGVDVGDAVGIMDGAPVVGETVGVILDDNVG